MPLTSRPASSRPDTPGPPESPPELRVVPEVSAGQRHARPSAGRHSTGRAPAGYQPAHSALICVAAPHLTVSAEHGQLTGTGMEGVYSAGRRVIARCQLLLAGREPIPLQGRMTGAGQARFIAAAPTVAGSGPDPEVTVERLRSADGTERITVRNAGGRTVRLPVELRLGTDLAEIGAVAVGRAGAELAASVHGSGLSWRSGDLRATVAADPSPDASWARPGLLRWDWELPPGAVRAVVLRTELTRATVEAVHARPGGASGTPRAQVPASRTARPPRAWHDARADGDDSRVGVLFRVALDDANALLMRDPAAPSDLHLAAGAPWRCALAPAESLRAARILLPLGTRLAAGTLRTLARSQLTEPGGDAGRLPGTLRHAGPYAPPSCTGTEATLLFPAVLAEARRWGLPEHDLEQLVPAAQRCLEWLLSAAGGDVYVPDPAPGGPYRCEVQASAHRAALLGADLLDACGGDGGGELRDWAAELRRRFQEEFWHEDEQGGRPFALRTRTGAGLPHLGCGAVELLDTGLTGGGTPAAGLLSQAQTERLATMLAGPALDSGWGLRSLDSREPRHNPFGHRSGAVRVQESVTAVAGLAAAGHEQEAEGLLRGVLDAAQHFGLRLPEMYAAAQRGEGGTPIPHPAACRPAAVAAAGAVHLLTTLAGVRPDAPAGTVCLRPLGTAPLGAVEFSGLRVAGEPFSVRVSRLGTALVEEAADGIQLIG
ncbi:MAG: glycogen debranching N-terminal domain-containing protein [Streptomyces sp.]